MPGTLANATAYKIVAVAADDPDMTPVPIAPRRSSSRSAAARTGCSASSSSCTSRPRSALAAAARHLARRDPRRRRRLRAAPYLLAQRAPGRVLARARSSRLGLMAYSALFISQSHGLIEMHFHIFGALAFLLVYRDWRVIVLAAGVDRRASPRLHAAPGRAAPASTSCRAEHLGLGMVLLHAVFVVFETSVLVILSRSLEQETLDDRPAARRRRRRARPARRARRRARAARPERRRAAGDGAAAILRSGIGHVATLVETIQSTADRDLPQTSQRGVLRLRRLRALQRGDRRRRRQRRVR